MPIWRNDIVVIVKYESIFKFKLIITVFLTIVHSSRFDINLQTATQQNVWRDAFKNISQPFSNTHNQIYNKYEFSKPNTLKSPWHNSQSMRELDRRLQDKYWSRNYETKLLGTSYKTNKRKQKKWKGLLSSTEESFEEIQHKRPEDYVDIEDISTIDHIRDCSLYPNNTFNAPFAFACETREEKKGFSPPPIIVHETAFANETGDYVYPLDLTQTLRIFLDLTSYSTRRYDNMRAQISVYERKVGWKGCGWSFVPTFNTLDSMEICDESNPSCPIYPGRQVLEMKVEGSRSLARVLRIFYDDRMPYQLRVRVFNNRQLGEELFCVTFQARVEV